MNLLTTRQEYEITEVKRYSRRIRNALNRLIPQLSSSAADPSAEHIRAIIRSRNSRLFVASAGKKQIAGMYTLVSYEIPTGTRFWIEDVVVDESFRSHGVGEMMMIHAIDTARKKGAMYIDLTSRPERVPANKLYQKLGFIKRETNSYRYNLT